MVSVSQSIQATAPSMMGEPLGAGVQLTPEYLSPPRAANWRHSCSWSAPRMLTQNLPAWRNLAQLPEFDAGRKATSGGSSETLVNEPTTMPSGVPSSPIAVTTVTPVG